MAPEKVRLRIGNLSKAVLITGQAYQDPKDALNEFVSNAADEYAEMGRRGGRIRIVRAAGAAIPSSPSMTAVEAWTLRASGRLRGTCSSPPRPTTPER
jgi:hypothetical protein